MFQRVGLLLMAVATLPASHGLAAADLGPASSPSFGSTDSSVRVTVTSASVTSASSTGPSSTGPSISGVEAPSPSTGTSLPQSPVLPRVSPDGKFYLAVVPTGVPSEANLQLELNSQRMGSYSLSEYQLVELTPQLRAGENQAYFSFSGALESTEVQIVVARGHTPAGEETLQLDIPIIRLQRGGVSGAAAETFRFTLPAGGSAVTQP
ncbi:MAG: hypothetical protein ACKO6N_19875 [Myxococcota bacterium]